MGSSSLPGEILNAITGLGSPVQIVVTQADRLPGWVGAADAVIAVSCSGTTPETLAIAAEAARRGCRLAGVGAPGSPLHQITEQARAPFVPVAPAGWPRSMLWGVSIPLLVIAEQLGIVRIGADVYELAASRLEEVSHQCRPASESFVNPGKSLALDLVGALPMVWGTSVLSGVAARRFASQLNENAKYPAISGVLSAAAHNQVAAFDGPFAPSSSRLPAPGPDEPILPPVSEAAGLEDLDAWDLDYEETDDSQSSGFTALRLVLIVDPDQDQRAAAQRAAVTDLVAQRGVGMSELAMDGEHPLVRLAGVIQLVDYASVYLAIASGIDPGQAVAIDDLQSRIE
jgi:glucose/mannose-6-phosphate isomerase